MRHVERSGGMRHGERSGRRLGRVRGHLAPSAAAANTAVIAETEELPNGTQVLRFEADRPLLESARGMPKDEPPSDDDEPDEPRGSVVADAHKCWAQAHVSCAESFIATRRIVPTCTEKDAH